jgi:hypothetical protein
MAAKGWVIVVGVLAVVTMGAGWVWAEAEPAEVAVRKAISTITSDVFTEKDVAIIAALKVYKVPEIQAALETIYETGTDVPTKRKVLSVLYRFSKETGIDQEGLRAVARKALFENDPRIAYDGACLALTVMKRPEQQMLFRQRLETADDPDLLARLADPFVFDADVGGEIIMRELQRPIPDAADKAAREKWYRRLFEILQLGVREQSALPGMREKLVDLIAVEPSLVKFVVPRLAELGAGTILARLRALHDKAASEDAEMALAAAIACLDPSAEEKERFLARFIAAVDGYAKTGDGWRRVLRLHELVCLMANVTSNEALLVKACNASKQLPLARRVALLRSMIGETTPYLAWLAFDALEQEELKRMLVNSPILCDELRLLNPYVPRNLPDDTKARVKQAKERLNSLVKVSSLE